MLLNDVPSVSGLVAVSKSVTGVNLIEDPRVALTKNLSNRVIAVRTPTTFSRRPAVIRIRLLPGGTAQGYR